MPLWLLITTQAAVFMQLLSSLIWHSSLCVSPTRTFAGTHSRTWRQTSPGHVAAYLLHIKTVRGMMSLSYLKLCNRQTSSAAFKTFQQKEHPSRWRGVDKHNLLGNVCNLPAQKNHFPLSATFYTAACMYLVTSNGNAYIRWILTVLWNQPISSLTTQQK